MERLVFHIDVNSAFLSWEASRRVKNGEADIRLIPAAIGGDKEKRTGIILAKSIPAKRFGVTTGEPVAMALRKCPQLYLAKPDFELYEACSNAFMNICREYAPVVSKFSIDECFCDMSGTSEIYPDPAATAQEMKNRIRDTLGFTVNIGIAHNRLLAKMASDFEKPDKVHTLFEEEIPEKLWPLPVGDLFSVGKATAAKFEKAAIYTIGDLARTDLKQIQLLAGEKTGKQLYEYANGIDDEPVTSEREETKGYSISTTLEADVCTEEEALQVLRMLADSVTVRMRADGARAYCIGVTIRNNEFKNYSHQRKLQNATDVTDEVYKTAGQLFRELWRQPMALRMLGISLTDITRDCFEQISLFPDEKKEKSHKLDQALDSIRSKYGMDAVYRGSTAGGTRIGRKYKAQMERKRKDTSDFL